MITERENGGCGSPAWQATIAVATIVGTLATSCMMPFVALATLTAATMPRRQAAMTIGAIWSINQLLGFTLLGYPADATTIAWGAAIGAAGLGAMMVAAAILGRAGATLPRLAAAFAAAFVVYEAGLFGFALVAGGTGTFTAAIVAAILLNDACWGAALFALHAVLTRAAPRTFGAPIGLATA